MALNLALGDAVEVEAEGEWWDAHVEEHGEGKVRVHYVGGTEDEDEWIELTSDRLRLPKAVEVVWNKGTDGIPWPAAVLEGSLANAGCPKLLIKKFLMPNKQWIRREQATPFTPESIPKRFSSKKLGEAIEAAQKALQKGSLSGLLPEHDEDVGEPETKRRKGAKGAAYSTAAGDANSRVSPAERRHLHRLAVMRRLGLAPPLDAL